MLGTVIDLKSVKYDRIEKGIQTVTQVEFVDQNPIGKILPAPTPST